MHTAFIKYQAAAASNVVVATGKAILHRILIGADITSGDIQVADHPSDATVNVKIKKTGSTLMTANSGVIDVGAVFTNGIVCTLTNQTQVTFIWEPVA